MPYTPGPWTVDGTQWPSVYGATDRAPICHIVHYADATGAMPEEDQSNARLIAAAPDLLEACREASNMLGLADIARMVAGEFRQPCEMEPPVQPTIDKLLAAIAKAEGR